ncbi:MAG: hypothetical protein V3T83_14885 [Acidobacteriota bacterium]
MRAAVVWKALGPIDVRNVGRDPMLRLLALMPFFLAAGMRWGTPFAAQLLDEQMAFDLTPYYMLIVSMMLPVMPMICGMLIGFLLLDQRDDRTLTALQVTPLTLGGYLVYRITLPMLVGAVTTLAFLPLIGLIEIAPATLLLGTLAAAPAAPIFALFLASFARNKVQGFALMKANGVVTWPLAAAYFVDYPWQLAFGLIPFYWPVKFFWMRQSGEEHAWIFLVLGLIWQGILVWLLLRRFDRVSRE